MGKTMAENLLGEDEPEAQEKGTIYVVFRCASAGGEEPRSRPADRAWREEGRAGGANQRAAIINVVGEDAEGLFRAVPEQSARIHRRKLVRRGVWDESDGWAAPSPEVPAVEGEQGAGVVGSGESANDAEMAGEA